MIYGYARVSTREQQINRQIKNIQRYNPDAKIYKDRYTGTRIDRPEFAKLLRKVGAGDAIVFDEVSRMSRNAEEGFALYKELYESGVKLVFLKEPHISTESYEAALGIALPAIATGDGATQKLVDGILDAIKVFMLAKVEQDIMRAFEQAQKEVEYLHQRTKEGMEAAREAGKQIGNPKGAKLTTKKSVEAKKIIKEHCVAFGGSLKDSECMRLAGVSRNSYFKYKKEVLEEKAR